MYQQNQNEYYDIYRQQPSVQFIPPSVIERYVNQWIETSIQGYGRVVAYVLDYNPRNGMVSLLIYPRPDYQQQYIQVHHSDLVGISPYTGPTPPRPRPPRPRPPRPRPPWSPGQPSYPDYPWQPWPPHQQPWQPWPGQPQQPGQPGGGFWPWVWSGLFGHGQQ